MGDFLWVKYPCRHNYHNFSPPPYRPWVPSAAILCTGAPDVIRKEAWPFYRTSSGVRLCWELEEPKGPKGRALLDLRICPLVAKEWGD